MPPATMWHEIEEQKDASGVPMTLALAAQALVDNGCGCDDYEETGQCTGECLAARCEAALHEQFDEINRLRAEVAVQAAEIERLRGLCGQAASHVRAAADIVEDDGGVDEEDIEEERAFADVLESAVKAMPGGKVAPAPQPAGSAERTPVDGTCCSCGYNGAEETPCQAREDRTHCEHWWDGPDESAGAGEPAEEPRGP